MVLGAMFGLLKHNFYSLKSNTPLSRTLCSKNTSIHLSRTFDLRAGICNTNTFVPCVRKNSTFAIWKGYTAARRLKIEYVGVPGYLPII